MPQKTNFVFTRKRAIPKTIKGYCDRATVHGLSYVSDSTSFPLDRCLWLLVCIIFASLAIALSTQAYTDWQNDPVLTTVKTTGNFPLLFCIFSLVNVNLVHLETSEMLLIIRALLETMFYIANQLF